MTYENDKLIIPEEYQKMSVSELRFEKEKLYTQIRKDRKGNIQKTPVKHQEILFRF